MLNELNDKQKENLQRLQWVFHQVYDYNGDDELISNMNAEYSFDQNHVIRTDGSINFAVRMVTTGDSGEYASYAVAVRGGNYIIEAERFNGKWRYCLRVNRTVLESKYDEILRQYNDMVATMSDMTYYIDEWRPGGIIEDSMSIEDINCLS